MDLWLVWWQWVKPLRAACTRERTFLWLVVILIGFCVREDLLGVTSIVRALNLQPLFYDRLLDLFHSNAVTTDKLCAVWSNFVLTHHPNLVMFNNRHVLVVDGTNVAKEGRRMAGVHKLHQVSESNSKPEFIMGHFWQVCGVLAQRGKAVFSLPLCARLHGGVLFTNRDKRTLLDRLNQMIESLLKCKPCYMLADNYYAAAKIAQALLKQKSHLVTRVRRNAVAYHPALQENTGRKRGRPKKYGEKVFLNSLFDNTDTMQTATLSLYGEETTQVRFSVCDLFWRPAGLLVRYVAVVHPTRGRCILMCTDTSLQPEHIIKLYSYRFKIEVAFKSAKHVVGAFGYHFWSTTLDKVKRGAGTQYLHRKKDEYRESFRRKQGAYEKYVQLALIAQGVMIALSTTISDQVWRRLDCWYRTMHTDSAPSERIVGRALRNTLSEFLAHDSCKIKVIKFLRDRIAHPPTLPETERNVA